MIVEQREELREACAKVIMGWRALEIPWAYSGTVRCWHNADDVVLMTCHAWRPDEDDTQCMQVVERMVERGYLCSIQVEPGENYGGVFCWRLKISEGRTHR